MKKRRFYVKYRHFIIKIIVSTNWVWRGVWDGMGWDRLRGLYSQGDTDITHSSSNNNIRYKVLAVTSAI